jgi:hypothetical protein
MKKRYKRPPVEPAVKRDWLRRFEENGESVPQIAVKDQYDPRTVRKQIEVAKEEREYRESRNQVLRTAIESHYQDLCRYARDLRSSVSGANISSATNEVEKVASIEVEARYLEEALRQHLPRSPMWKGLKKFQQEGQKISQLEKALESRARQELTHYPGLATVDTGGEKHSVNNLTAVLTFQGKAWAQGLPGLNLAANFQVKAAKADQVNVSCGFAQVEGLSEEQAALIKRALIGVESRIRTWEEWSSLERAHGDKEKVKAALQDELAVIILKRVIPGKCKYCPL